MGLKWLDKLNAVNPDHNAIVKNARLARASVLPDELLRLAEEWKTIITCNTIKVETGRTDIKSGRMIEVHKPEPPTIESFIHYVGIDTATWFDWLMGKRADSTYVEVARDIKDFCNMMILRYMMLGLISEKASIFYLVNNSRYQDKAEVVQTVQNVQKPAWLDASAGRIEDIDHEDIPEL